MIKLLRLTIYFSFLCFSGGCFSVNRSKKRPPQSVASARAFLANHNTPPIDLYASDRDREVQDSSDNVSSIQSCNSSYPYRQFSEDIRGEALPINSIDALGHTALSAAVQQQNIEEVKRLLHQGANPNIFGCHGDQWIWNVPLNRAIQKRNQALIALLLDNGAVVIDSILDSRNTWGKSRYHSNPAIRSTILDHFSSRSKPSVACKDIRGKYLMINQIDVLGYSALYRAVIENDLQEATRLLSLGANPNIFSPKKNPLKAAIRKNNEEIVKLLLSNGALIMDESVGNRDLLSMAKYKSKSIHNLLLSKLSNKQFNHDHYKGLHDREVTDINEVDASGSTKLYYAALKSDVSEVERLLGLGAHANVGMGNVHFCSPLYTAIIGGQEKIVSLLLSHGAEVIFESDDKSDMLSSAIHKPKILSMLLCQVASTGRRDEHFNSTPLHWASRDGYTEVVADILAKNPSLDVNDRDPTYNFTPLHWAARRGYKEIVNLLLSNGADKTAQSKHGFTPLMLAICNAHDDLKEILAPDGFKREIKNLNLDWTCNICLEGISRDRGKIFPIVPLACGHRFHLECIKKNVLCRTTCPTCRDTLSDDMVSAIQDHGVVDSPFSILHAVVEQDREKLKKLLSKGGNPNENLPNGSCIPLIGNSPLIASILEGNLDMVKLLLQYGASLEYSDAYYARTPLHWACWESSYRNKDMVNQAIICTLLQHGASVNLRGSNPDTPLDHCYRDCKSIMLEAGGLRTGSWYDIKNAFGLGGEEEGDTILRQGTDLLKR